MAESDINISNFFISESINLGLSVNDFASAIPMQYAIIHGRPYSLNNPY